MKQSDGEDPPPEIRKPATLRAPDDPLGCDTRDIDAATEQMIQDVKSGRTADAVAVELANVRRLFSGGAATETERKAPRTMEADDDEVGPDDPGHVRGP